MIVTIIAVSLAALLAGCAIAWMVVVGRSTRRSDQIRASTLRAMERDHVAARKAMHRAAGQSWRDLIE